MRPIYHAGELARFYGGKLVCKFDEDVVRLFTLRGRVVAKLKSGRAKLVPKPNG